MEIAGFVVRAFPKDMDTVANALSAIEGTEVHIRDQSGKLIVTTEHRNQTSLKSAMNHIQNVEGMLSVSMVWQYSDENEQSREAEMPR